MGEIRLIAILIVFGMATPALACETQAIRSEADQILHEDKSELGYFCVASSGDEIILVIELSNVQTRWSLMEVVRSFLDVALARVETEADMRSWQDLRSKLISRISDKNSLIRLYLLRNDSWNAFLLKNVHKDFLTSGPYEVSISARSRL
jgi:hypothetical protein